MVCFFFVRSFVTSNKPFILFVFDGRAFALSLPLALHWNVWSQFRVRSLRIDFDGF